MMRTQWQQVAASLAGSYVMERELGAGGMATVFLARDLRHERLVAIKLLRPDLAQRMGVERFLREVRTTATLHHPHIVPLYDSGEANGLVYYVMPYIEGESLRDRLRRDGQLSVTDAVRIASDIANALDYAHRHGFVHRDVKPENILLHESRALIADFGIALAIGAIGAIGASGASGSDLRLTESGVSIGTPQYMSPEQAMGERQLTARTDIFALGAILYEMLAGEPPFTGESAQAIVAKMMTATPVPIRSMRPTVPAYVAAAIDGALQKVPADRFATAAAFATALERPTLEATTSAAEVRTPIRRRATATRAGVGAALLLASALGGAAVTRTLWPSPSAPLLVARAVLPLGHDQLLHLDNYPLSISRDGQFLVYVAEDSGKAQLYVRPLADSVATLLPQTDGASSPFFSPDGAWIAFFADGKLKKVPRSGGAPLVIADARATIAGAQWGADGSMLYSFGDSALYRIGATGGAPVAIVAEPASSARRHALGALKWPAFLPGETRALVTTDSGVGIMDLTGGGIRTLFRGGQARYLPTGQLLFDDHEGRARVVAFDAKRGEVHGNSVPVFEAFRGPAAGAVYFTVADNGTLVYMEGSFRRFLVRVDRYGRESAIDVAPRGYRFPAISPDGRFVAVTVDPRPSAIWLVDLKREDAVPLTTDRVHSIGAQWSPDGTRIVFTRYPDSTAQPYWLAAHTGAVAAPGFTGAAVHRHGKLSLTQWSRTAGIVGFESLTRPEQVQSDIVRFQVGDTATVPIIASSADERQAVLSPDGRWLAYASNVSGAFEVYVRPFPNDGASVPISSHGGVEPQWSPTGGELYFRSGSRIMSAAIRREAKFAVAGAPTVLFSGPFDFSQDNNWCASVDGRFIMVKTDPTTGRELQVVFNWFAEAKAAGAR